MLRSRAILALSALLASGAMNVAAAQEASVRCAQLAAYGSHTAVELAQLTDAPTGLIASKPVAADRDLPGFCRVEGIVAPSIGFELDLPLQGWNGKLMMQGCGGMCGTLATAQAEEALVRNYAVVVTDLGHKGNGGMAMYAYHNLENEIDFGYRATHVVTLAAKAIVDQFYGTAAARSYFMGCSTGGRQGMVEAQRFPRDFDGIIAGAPPYNETGDLPLFMLWGARSNIDSAGKPILDAAKLPMIHAAVLAACDALDGRRDGLLQDPRRCGWDPAALQCHGADAKQCLTAAEVGVVRKIYDGASDSKGRRLYFGMSRGSEYYWSPGFVGANGALGANAGAPGSFASQFLGSLAFYDDPGPHYDAATYDYDRDPQRSELTEPLYNAQNPDLRKFRDAGAKLILYHGWDDNEIPPGASLDYYETATRTMGGPKPTQEFFRLFMIPGMNHCRRGPGGDTVDWISYLEKWVEQQQAPDAVIVHHLKTEQNYSGLPRPRFPLNPALYDRTRPVYPYPDMAAWSGRGDPDQAISWKRAVPTPERNSR